MTYQNTQYQIQCIAVHMKFEMSTNEQVMMSFN